MRSGNEDKSLGDDGNLEVDNHVTAVRVTLQRFNTEPVLEERGVLHGSVESNGRGGEVDTISDTERENFGKIPRVGCSRRKDSVKRKGHDGTVVENSDDQDHEGREVESPGEGHDGEAEYDTDGNGTSVDSIVPHTLEDDSRTVDGVDDSRETGLSKDNVSGTSGSVGGTLDGDTDVGTRKSRGIVGTVTSHGTKVAKVLDTLDNLELVLGEDTGETIGVHDHLVKVGMLATSFGTFLQNLSRVHVVTKTKSSTGFLSNSKLVTSNHLDLDTESHSVVNSLLGVRSRRVKDRKETDKLETVTLGGGVITSNILVSDSESTETTSGKLLNISLKLVFKLVGLATGTEFNDDTSHTLGSTLKLATVHVVSVSDLGTLVNRVEGLEVKELNTTTSLLGVRKGTNDTTVNGVLVLGTGSIGGEETDALNVPLGVALDILLVNSKLVGGEGTGLVGTENGDTGKLFNGSDTGNDSLVLGELLGTDGKGDGQDSRHGNGDTTNEQDKDVVKTTSVRVSEVGVENQDLEEDEDTDGAETERTDTSKDLLQVTDLVIVLTDKSGSTTEESVGTGGNNDTLGLTLLTGGTRETLVTLALADGKRLASKSSLVHAVSIVSACNGACGIWILTKHQWPQPIDSQKGRHHRA